MLALWWLVSLAVHETVVASPAATLTALLQLLGEHAFWSNTLWPSVLHILAGFCLAGVLGLGFGALAGRFTPVRQFLAPIRLVLTSTPAAVGVVLFILWLGLGPQMIIVIVGVFIAPVFYLALCEGFDAIDNGLSEMMSHYQVTWQNRWRHLVLPSLWPSLLPAMRLSIANAVRLTILAEILSASHGLGEAIEQARSYLQTDRLFALLVIVVGLVVVFERFSLLVLSKVKLNPGERGE